MSSVGCRHRAYSDLYVENMAAEIRDLEDQLYEYDYEYRLLEQELSSLRQQNNQIQSQTPSTSSQESTFGNRQPLQFMTPASPTVVPDPVDPYQGDNGAQGRSSILEDNSSSSGPEEVPSLPAESGQGNAPRETPPSRVNPFDRGQPQADPAGEDSGFGTSPDDLLPPQIDLGEPMTPPLPTSSYAPISGDRAANSQPQMDALELNVSRIEIPAQFASQKTLKSSIQSGRTGSQSSASNTDFDSAKKKAEPNNDGELNFTPGFATIRPAVEQVTDQRIVELAFHPTLSRAANFDDVTDDDGLYLVLQPRNEKGQVVPIAANLSVVILDPSRSGKAARIGRRDYSATEVKSKTVRSGSKQGIHLTLPWNGPDPNADRVIVFVRYTFPDGRQVIGEKTFFVSGPGGLKTVWAPRAEEAGASTSTRGSSNVVSASFQSATEGQKVVRPSVGSSVGKSEIPAPPR
ncbi:MAG: hypothetical protein AB8B50_14950 [Pirellulaceae bacterium]